MDESEEEGEDAMRKDNVVSAHKMGRDDLMRSDGTRDNSVRSEEEMEDVMSCLFEWDFDQLLRQAENNIRHSKFRRPPASRPQLERGPLGLDLEFGILVVDECRC